MNAISSLQGKLTKENKAYIRKLHAYLILASAFHGQEERATELLLSIYQDVLDAQADGQSAEEFLGKDSSSWRMNSCVTCRPFVGIMVCG
ncbi:hypothetical protein [Streptococcus parasuis]|uniref:hypothetical protein n=1 Tax=Streptococcus parasuis TaxID=1501662 RepID=UPI001F5E6661|nr:hypothetical protein [Streptococcus parasuis]